MTEQIEWRNRIVESGVKPASQFMAHPNNWRTHPQRQRKALKGSLDTLGWVAPVLENRRTGYLIDGHERVWQALQNGDAQVPYIQVDLDESEEAQALLSLDAIAALAQTDAGKVDELLRLVDTGNADVQQFLAGMAADSGLYDDPGMPTPLDDVDLVGAGELANRMIIVFDSEEEKQELFAKLGSKPLAGRMVYRYRDIVSG